ncbi:MAG: transposase [Planctomycetes bacterium]|nr:transposase [Planctomycetota bacterium]
MKRHYQRHLPHQVPEGFPIFLTWNLKGAFPPEAIARIREERERLEREPICLDETSAARRIRHDKLAFAYSDRILDAGAEGPLDLKDASNAKIVEGSILFGVPERYELFAWCVMANHVHVLLHPIWELPRITKGIKGFTAREINKKQQEVGRVFWQDESYDHWARDHEEVMRIIAYTEDNPVTAGLCVRPEDWPWSSARFRAVWEVGQAFQPDMQPKTSGWKA